MKPRWGRWKAVAWLQRNGFPAHRIDVSTRAQNYSDPGELDWVSRNVPFAVANLRAENGPATAHVESAVPIGRQRLSRVRHSFVCRRAGSCGGARILFEYLLQLLGPDRIIPKNEIAKDYPNYDGDYAHYPIDTARFRRVLTLAAEKAGWGKQKSGNGYGMGVAMHRSFLTYVATWFRCR